MEAEEEDQGSYECVADNSKGTAVSGPATLYVRGTFSDTNLRGVQNTNDLKTLTKKCFKTIWCICQYSSFLWFINNPIDDYIESFPI